MYVKSQQENYASSMTFLMQTLFRADESSLIHEHAEGQ
jgi:hypothetical protein